MDTQTLQKLLQAIRKMPTVPLADIEKKERTSMSIHKRRTARTEHYRKLQRENRKILRNDEDLDRKRRKLGLKNRGHLEIAELNQWLKEQQAEE